MSAFLTSRLLAFKDTRGCVNEQPAHTSNTILFLILPMFLILISIILLSSSYCGGLMNAVTPPGVPVMITVPFLNGFPRVK
jgi:hypothetical protein